MPRRRKKSCDRVAPDRRWHATPSGLRGGLEPADPDKVLVVPLDFREEVERLKLLTSVASPSLQQRVIAEFLETGGYDRYLKRLRTRLVGQVESVRHAMAKYFPQGTRISRPAGGYMLWIEFPPQINALKLYRAALAENISILPGTIFSATGQYKNHIRINCGHVWSEIYDRALLTLARLCEKAQASRLV